MKKLDHSAYSPDITMRDFQLFGKMKGKCFSTEKEFFDEVQQFLNSIEKSEIQVVYKKWIRRLNIVIKSGGEYIINK